MKNDLFYNLHLTSLCIRHSHYLLQNINLLFAKSSVPVARNQRAEILAAFFTVVEHSRSLVRACLFPQVDRQMLEPLTTVWTDLAGFVVSNVLILNVSRHVALEVGFVIAVGAVVNGGLAMRDFQVPLDPDSTAVQFVTLQTAQLDSRVADLASVRFEAGALRFFQDFLTRGTI